MKDTLLGIDKSISTTAGTVTVTRKNADGSTTTVTKSTEGMSSKQVAALIELMSGGDVTFKVD